MNLVFEGFLQTCFPPLISTFYAWDFLSRFSVEVFFYLTVPKKFVGGTNLSCFQEKFWYRNFSCIRRRVSQFSVEIIKSKNVSKGWDSNPYLPTSETCCPTHCPMGTIGISDKCQSNHKNIWHNRDSNPDLLLENPVVLTALLSFVFEWKELAILDWKKRKKEKRPY